MKFTKLFALALTVLLLFSFGMAEESGLNLEGIEINPVKEIEFLEATCPDADYSIGVGTTDTVNVYDSGKSVATPDGIVFTYSSNNYLAISQDVLADYYLYSNCFNDIVTAQEWMVSNECHLFIIGNDVQAYLYDDGISDLSNLIGNATELTDAEAAQVANLYGQQYTGAEINYGYLGGNVWFVLTEGDTTVLITFVNGHEIFASTVYTNIDEVFNAIDGLTVSGL